MSSERSAKEGDVPEGSAVIDRQFRWARPVFLDLASWRTPGDAGVIRRVIVLAIEALLLLLCGLPGTAFTQTTYGLIEGRITDITGGALPGATITVTQPTTGFLRTVVTNGLGLYRVLNLNPAEYDVTVERTGFAKVLFGSVKVDVGQAVALNVGMEVGKVAVVMDIAPPTINAVTPEISNTIDRRRVN